MRLPSRAGGVGSQMKDKTIPIYFKVESFEPDPVQFKPAKPVLKPQDLYVRLDVPEKYFIKDLGSPKGSLCLSERGFSFIRRVLSGLEKIQ
jgi:hypothetical protein